MRLTLFVAAVTGAWVLAAAGRGAAAWGAGGAMAVVFAVLVARQRAARLRRTRFRLMADFNREGVARMERRWDDLPLPPEIPRERQDAHDYASDLDLGGRASLLHLIGVCGTDPGWRTLRRWLLAPARPAAVHRRQEAVREMAEALDFRDRLAAEARLVGARAEVRPDFAQPPATALIGPWQRAASWILPPVNMAAIVLNAAGAASAALVGWALLASTLVLLPRWKAVHRRFATLDDGESGVRRYGPLLQHLHRAPLQSPMAASIGRRIGAANPPATADSRPRPRPAHQEIATLRRLLDMADLRRSPLFHLPLAVILHWDAHVLVALERWTERCGARVRGWLEAVGEAEALAALAALAADHPDWTMPSLQAAPHPPLQPDSAPPPTRDPPSPRPNRPPVLRARALGHPLLPPTDCVRNDVEIGPPGSFLLVTGSNMSGKSTLLRAVGLNTVLAQAGGPVCAAGLHMPPVRVATSMRVEDSLAHGVSHFMAELLRLRRVVDAARSASGEGMALYLLDEILQGTNSAERRIAARTVLRHLLDTGAIGAVTTHDLSLADAEDLLARADAVHFAETVGIASSRDGPAAPDARTLTFDYRLRRGIATSTNALKLLEIAGLGRR